MIPAGVDTNRFGELVLENERVLRRFGDKGVDLSRAVAFEFSVLFDAKDRLTACRDELKRRFTGQPLEFADDYGPWCTTSDAENGEFELRLPVVMRPRAEDVSFLEAVIGLEAEKFAGTDVAWEFADARNNTKGLN